MPRQLPWKGGGGSRTKTTKSPARPSRPTRIPDGSGDDLFEGAALASTRSKGKEKARATSGSDSSLPEHHNEESTPQSKRPRTKDPNERPPSSSPPPLVAYALPHSSPMHKGVSNFDLRDDEWMMVEDEFLETAKLFTKHLHIAEYDRLKHTIEAKKKQLAQARPVVAGAERSAEGALRAKAKAQEIRQKQAIRDVFASRGDSSGDDVYSDRRRPMSKTVKPPLSSKVPSDTDSDDLDARHVPKPKSTASAPASKPTAPATKPNVQSGPPHASKPAVSSTSFATPVLPAAAKSSRSRLNASRMTPFDMLDDYTPPPPSVSKKTPATTQAAQPPSPTNPSPPRASEKTTTSNPTPTRRSADMAADWGPPSSTGTVVRKEVAARLAKRKAERAKGNAEQGEKRASSAQLDDIPTFLF